MPTEADSEKGGAVEGWLILMGKSGKWVGGDQDAFMSDSDHKQATKSPRPWEARGFTEASLDNCPGHREILWNHSWVLAEA